MTFGLVVVVLGVLECNCRQESDWILVGKLSGGGGGRSHQLGRGRLQRQVTVKDLSSPATVYWACILHICSLPTLAQAIF